MAHLSLPGLHQIQGTEEVSVRWVAHETQPGGFATADIRLEDAGKFQGWLHFYTVTETDPFMTLDRLRQLFERLAAACTSEQAKHVKAPCRCEEAKHE